MFFKKGENALEAQNKLFNNTVLSLLCVIVGWFLCLEAADQFPGLSVVGVVIFTIWFLAIYEYRKAEEQKERENDNNQKGK